MASTAGLRSVPFRGRGGGSRGRGRGASKRPPAIRIIRDDNKDKAEVVQPIIEKKESVVLENQPKKLHRKMEAIQATITKLESDVGALYLELAELLLNPEVPSHAGASLAYRIDLPSLIEKLKEANKEAKTATINLSKAADNTTLSS
jgi:hypothetical protein